jgi:hypothetical protein
MKNAFLHHPLVHILFFGFLLAIVIFILLGPPTSPEASRQVIISDSDIAQLRATWMRQWQREPTPEELRGLVEQFIREEVMYREAVARGFDRDDMIVRRAMQRKMEFLGEAQVVQEVPTDEEIQSYFALRQERYRVPAVVSFVQIYVNVDKRGERAETEALEILQTIRDQPPDAEMLREFSDPSLLQNQHLEQTEQQIRSAFGEDFSNAVLQLDPGTWGGPIRSGYGLHLVYVYARQDSAIPAWQEVKPLLLDDMAREAAKAAKELFYTEILRSYEIIYRGEVVNILGENNE